ncbi:MAG: hypothetical protein ABIV94_06350 [Acidimicrobiales bacterium]
MLIVAALVAAGGDSARTGSGPTTSAPDTSFLPDYELDGAAGSVVTDEVMLGAPGATVVAGLDVRFSSFRDPARGFGGPQLYVQAVRDLAPGDARSVSYGDDGDQTRTVTIGGRSGHVTVLGPVVLVGIAPSNGVEDGLLLVGFQLSEPEVLSFAEGLSRGADGTWTSASPAGGLVAVASGVDTAPGESRRAITLRGEVEAIVEIHEGDAATFEGLVRDRISGSVSASISSVAGEPAVLLADATGTAQTMLWQPTPGTVAELRGAATSEQIAALAGALRPVHQDRWLQQARPPADPAPSAPPPPSS